MDVSLLPADTYQVVNKSIITNEDIKILNMLYLPITGPLAIMLYINLINDLDKTNIISEEINHAHLVSNLHISLIELQEARNVLEAIGLLKTYIQS